MSLFEGDDAGATEQPEADEMDRQLAEAEARWKEVGYYRQLTAGTLFDDAEDPIAQRVNHRLRDFARREIAAIVSGVEVSAGPSKEHARLFQELAKFTDQHLGILRQLADTLDERRISALRVVLDGILRDPASVHALIGPTLRKPSPPVAATTPPPEMRRPVIPTKRPMVTPSPTPAKKAPAVKRAVRAPFPTGEAFSRATERLANEAVAVNEKASDTRLRALSALSNKELAAVHEAESNT